MSKISILMNFVRPFFDELYIMCAFEKPNFSEIRSSFEMNIKITSFFQGQKSPGFHGKAILSVFWSHVRFVRCFLVQKLLHLNLIHG